MKKQMAGLVRSLTMTILMIGAWPQMAAADPGWTAYGTVEEVYPNSGGIFYFRMTLSANPSSCMSPEWFYNNGTGAGADRIFAVLLSAQATEKTVRVFVTGTCNASEYSEISSASVK